jgi:GNAT superfamily N-acetyltransferase
VPHRSPPQAVAFRHYAVADVPEDAFGPFAALAASLAAVANPHDAPPTAAHLRAEMQGLAAMGTFVFDVALAWSGDRLVGFLVAGGQRSGTNPHLLQLDLGVAADRRRQGIGRALLEEALVVARRDGRRLLVSGASDRVPAGAAFARAVGARPGLEMRVSELDLHAEASALFGPSGTIAAWCASGPQRAPGYELRWLERPLDDDAAAHLAVVKAAMNTAPHGDIDVRAEVVTPERVRAEEALYASREDVVWTVVAVERSTGTFAGFTQVGWQARNPRVVEQHDTAVLEAHRGHGLGRWLKATMLDRVHRERPEARVVRTGNADTNAPMLAINEALGFRVARATTVWQLDVGDTAPA